ncbi:MAG: hypothetical protein ACSHWW_13140 [Nonlabens sp.]|uniref:hypothetical protein n=1 Tax=Nonlabens sp. TaxID=1888209 RepID=UPI003EF13302
MRFKLSNLLDKEITILYHILILTVVSHGFTLWTSLRLPVLILAIVFIFYRNVKIEKWVLIIYSLFFAGHIYSNYYNTANHYFLLGIFTWYVTYKLWFKDSKWNFPLYLISLIFSIATLQKLISPYFMNGNLYAELFLSGDSTPYIGELLFTDYNHLVEQFQEFYTIRYGGHMTSLEVSDSIVMWIKVMTYVILLVELIVTAFLLFARHYYKYLVFLIFIIGTAFLRFEYGFFSILLLICLFDVKLPQTRLHKYYLAVFLVMIVIYTLYNQKIIFGS